MINPNVKAEDRFCNCKQSRCMKLYCECLSSGMACGKNCRCIGCQNTTLGQTYQQKHIFHQKIARQQNIRTHKGCACRRSNCNKKYCECFQSGILCRDTCKCIECHNNESLTNRKVVKELRKNNSQITNNQTVINLYPLYISQNAQHLRSIIIQSNPLCLEQNWFENCAKALYTSALQGNEIVVMDKFLSFLIDLDESLDQQLKYKIQSFSDNIDQQKNKEEKQMKRDNQKNKEQKQQQEQLLQQKQQYIQNPPQNLQIKIDQNSQKNQMHKNQNENERF